jgi:hypothetical protein
MTLDDEFKSALSREAECGFSGLNDRDQLLHAIWHLEGDVNNGGFDQYYFNSGGDQAKIAPSMLRAIGAECMATIVETANAVFGPDGPSPDRNTRQETLAVLTESDSPWERLDQEFWAYPDDISKLLEEFLSARPVA